MTTGFPVRLIRVVSGTCRIGATTNFRLGIHKTVLAALRCEGKLLITSAGFLTQNDQAGVDCLTAAQPRG